MFMSKLVISWNSNSSMSVADAAAAREEAILRETMEAVAIQALVNILERWKRRVLFLCVHTFREKHNEAEAIKTAMQWAQMSKRGKFKRDQGSKATQFLKSCRRI